MERIESPVIGSGRNNIPWLQGVHVAYPFYTTRYAMSHVVSIEILHKVTIYPKLNGKALWISNLFLGDELRSYGSKRFARFHLKKYISRRR